MVAALLVLATAGPQSLASAIAAVAGAGLLSAGVGLGDRRLVSVGAASLLIAVVFAGVSGASVAALFVGAGGTVFAWDAGGTAIDLGAQLGREADTRRLEVVHAGASAGVAILAGVVGLGVFAAMAGGQPLASLLLLLLAAILLLSGIDV